MALAEVPVGLPFSGGGRGEGEGGEFKLLGEGAFGSPTTSLTGRLRLGARPPALPVGFVGDLLRERMRLTTLSSAGIILVGRQ